MTEEVALRRHALGALLLGFHGSTVPGWLAEALQAGLGGVVLFGSNADDGARVGELTAGLRAARLTAAGITADLAPVADVNSDPRDPVSGVRPFGADPDPVARHLRAAVRGIQRHGLAACVKHFPGHGDTALDSHHGVAMIGRTRAELEACEVVPFRAAIAAGARCVMTGHLSVPALDSQLTTVSSAITTDFLRGSLGFDGVVMTDALEMRAMSAQIGLADGVVRAPAAGGDAVETGAGGYRELVGAVPDAVVRAVADGRLSAARVADAARRTRGLARPGVVADVDGSATADVAARCIEVIGVPPAVEAPLIVGCRTPNGVATGALDWSFAGALAAVVDGADVVECTDAATAGLAVARMRARERSTVVVVRDPLRNPWQQGILDAVTTGRTVVVDAGWPADLDALIGAGVAVVRTRGIAPGLLAAAARRIGEQR